MLGTEECQDNKIISNAEIDDRDGFISKEQLLAIGDELNKS